MTDTAIQVEHLSKKYRIGAADCGARFRYKSLRDSLNNGLRTALTWKKRTAAAEASQTLWALQDVSFDVAHGEVVGIIGRNGAGKSTLLKVLSRISEPTAGRVAIAGRVGSLLEVGTGFHPELTGRENIFLNGAILGMRRVEIERKFDEIVAFAEVERFLDTPVKRYSSGMYMRLAFAVAAHLEPEILVVDEVLAVGDAEFQKKCLGRMADVARQGRTVLFVSHNIQAIRTLCTRGILLKEGRLACVADVDACVDRYVRETQQLCTNTWERPERDESGALLIRRVRLELTGEQPDHRLLVNMELESTGPHKPAFVAVDIRDSTGTALMQAQPETVGFINDNTTRHQMTIDIRLPPLVPGDYFISAWAGNHYVETLDTVQDCGGFSIEHSPVPDRTFPHHFSHGHIVASSTLDYTAQ